jgi:hypothetical protein
MSDLAVMHGDVDVLVAVRGGGIGRRPMLRKCDDRVMA